MRTSIICIARCHFPCHASAGCQEGSKRAPQDLNLYCASTEDNLEPMPRFLLPAFSIFGLANCDGERDYFNGHFAIASITADPLCDGFFVTNFISILFRLISTSYLLGSPSAAANPTTHTLKTLHRNPLTPHTTNPEHPTPQPSNTPHTNSSHRVLGGLLFLLEPQHVRETSSPRRYGTSFPQTPSCVHLQ